MKREVKKACGDIGLFFGLKKGFFESWEHYRKRISEKGDDFYDWLNKELEKEIEIENRKRGPVNEHD